MTSRSAMDPVGEVLTGAVAMVPPSATLTDAAQALTRDQLGLLLVVDGRGVNAVLSERDIVTAAGDGLDLAVERVVDHASDDIVTIDEEATIASAADLMASAEVRHLAVTRSGEIIGVVSVRDVVVVLASEHGASNPATAAR